MSSDSRFVEAVKVLLECDTARIFKPLDRLFLIIGFNKDTQDNQFAAWFEEGKRVDFKYVAEQTVASGDSLKELWRNACRYKRLSKFFSACGEG